MKIKKIPFLVIFIFISLTFLKIDYRFADGIFCCGDDHDYYMHAEPIAIARDLDYSNPFIGIDKVRYKNAEKYSSGNSREFCKALMKRDMVYRIEDIDAASKKGVN